MESKKRECKDKAEKKKLQTKITDTLVKLPENERAILEYEERKKRRAEIKEARENIWKRWRGKKAETKQKSTDWEKMRLEEVLQNAEQTLQRITEEREEQKRMEHRREEEKKAVEDEKNERRRETERMEVDRIERIKKKHQLEEKWQMMKWLT